MADSNPTDWMADYYARQAERRSAVETALKTRILPALAQAGVDRVLAEYSGYGDSGAIDSITCIDGSGTTVPMPEPVCEEGLRDSLYDFLPAGFEINEGGQGTLVLLVSESKVVLSHEENVTEVRSHAEEFEL